MVKPNVARGSDVRNQAIYWVSRMRSGEFSEGERRALDDWLRQDEGHRQEYHRIQQWLDGLRGEAPESFPEVEVARRPRTVRPQQLAVAASLLVAVSGVLWMTIISPSTETYRTEKGERTSVSLADGSQITLNTDTELELRSSWFSTRVSLSRGEALFTVAHDTHRRTFEVVAAGGTVRDLGTRFDVRYERDAVSVTVVEGRVVVWTDDERNALLLSANQRVSYDASGIITPVSTADAESSTAWNVGRILFRRTPLSRIFNEMARYHDLSIDVADPRVNAIEVNGTFRIDDVDGLLHAIETLLPVRFERLPGQGDVRLYRAFYQARNPAS